LEGSAGIVMAALSFIKLGSSVLLRDEQFLLLKIFLSASTIVASFIDVSSNNRL
jgi:hypothetical protein